MRSQLRMIVITFFIFGFSLSSCHKDKSVSPVAIIKAGPGEIFITYVPTSVGHIAIRIEVPDSARYSEGAPVVVHASTFFAPFTGFHRRFETTRIGAICISYLRPGRGEPESGAYSEGEIDHGGPGSLQALRDVIRFASGLIPNNEGQMIDKLLEVSLLTENVGLFASSHSGIVATNVLARHGFELGCLKYFVGRENPTRDEMYPLELGYFDDQRNPVYNPFYHPENYSSTGINIDYSTLDWLVDQVNPRGRPVFRAKGPIVEHPLHETICPTMWDKRYYSRSLLWALKDNGVFTDETWPDDLATPEEADAAWSVRLPVDSYQLIATSASHLKVMLVFAKKDHVQAALDKPHIRQAYDGFQKTAGLWVRLNPDNVYAESIHPDYKNVFPDNPANSEPADWMESKAWGYPAESWDIKEAGCLAAVAEMADRVRENDWRDNLNSVLNLQSD